MVTAVNLSALPSEMHTATDEGWDLRQGLGGLCAGDQKDDYSSRRGNNGGCQVKIQGNGTKRQEAERVSSH
jgi:hypothetical protein